MSKKKLLLSINDLKALGIIKKKHRKRYKAKEAKINNSSSLFVQKPCFL